MLSFAVYTCKNSWVYLLKKRDEDSVEERLFCFLDHELPKYGIRLKHFYLDRGAEDVSNRILTLLHRRYHNLIHASGHS